MYPSTGSSGTWRDVTNLTQSDVGLSAVYNERQFSIANPPLRRLWKGSISMSATRNLYSTFGSDILPLVGSKMSWFVFNKSIICFGEIDPYANSTFYGVGSYSPSFQGARAIGGIIQAGTSATDYTLELGHTDTITSILMMN